MHRVIDPVLAFLDFNFGRTADLDDGNAASQLGMPVSDAQKGDLLQFLASDPVLRGKLLNYLEQNVK